MKEKNKKVLLIYPSSISERSIMSEYEGKVPPSGLLYIAAVLKKKHSVKIYDENVNKDEFLSIIKKFEPNFVAINAYYSFQFPNAVKIAQTIKKYNKNIKIILGGVHINSANQKRLLEQYHFIDFLISGDGEYSLNDLVSGKDYKKINGLTYRAKNKVVSNKIYIIKDLDKLPFPARELINLEDYSCHPFEYTNHRNTFLVTSRGCPYNCINCFTTSYRAHSPKQVIQEIKSLLKKGIKDFTIYDASFTLDIKRAEAICDLIISKNLKFSWACETRIDKVDKNLLEKMSKAGCKSIMYGIEACNNENIDFLQKDIKVEQIKKVVDLTRYYKMKAYGTFMIGLPSETPEDIKKIVKFAKSLNLSMAWFTIATPLPGTKSWELADYDENDLETLKKISFYSGDISFWESKKIESCLNKAV